MFELDQYERGLHQQRLTAPKNPYSSEDRIDKVSLLSWGEHCTECAAPACYKSCDLYEPRPDKRCRRFRFGIHKNHDFSSVRNYGAEVSFKKWGVLAATGNTLMVRKTWVVWSERVFGVLAPVLNAIVPIMSRVTGDIRWSYPAFTLSRRLCGWLHSLNGGRTQPDAFLLEVFNPSEPARMQLVMDYAPDHNKQQMVQIRRQFRTTVEFPTGYSRHEFDRQLFREFTESGKAFNIGLTPEADTSLNLVFLSADFVTYKKKAVKDTAAASIKCVVWDLDNTMWDGTLVEQDAVHLKQGLRDLLETLDQRGILLSIASKNSHEAAWQRLQELGIADYFLAPHINWNPKSQNIKAIAQKLNIGIDTLAFIDDNPFELNEVKAAVPEVTCIDALDIKDLKTRPGFEGSNTADAQSRRRYYQESFAREETQAQFGDDYHHFLADCKVVLKISSYEEENFDRVAELVQRTNQLNFSGKKYDRDQLRAILEDPAISNYVLSVSDRFGSYGLVGFATARKAEESIDVHDFMLSCRVQSRLIEQAFFAHLERHHNPAGASTVRVYFTQTKRNQPAKQALEAAYFSPGTDGVYVRQRGQDAGEADIIRVDCKAGCPTNQEVDTEDATDRVQV